MKIKITYEDKATGLRDFQEEFFTIEGEVTAKKLEEFNEYKEKCIKKSFPEKVLRYYKEKNKVLRYYLDKKDEPIIKPSLAGQDIEDKITQPDFLLADKYQLYSSELLRLSLAGIAVFGFLIQYLKLIDSTRTVKILVGLSVVSLIISAGFALAHRYFSTDSIAYLIAYLRSDTLLNNDKKSFAEEQKFLLEYQRFEELKNYRKLLKRCDKFLKISIVALITGIVFLTIGLATMLFSK